jgi:hypothetical protein
MVEIEFSGELNQHESLANEIIKELNRLSC